MDKITIEVDEKLAQRWRQVQLPVKQQISREIERILGVVMEKMNRNFGRF